MANINSVTELSPGANRTTINCIFPSPRINTAVSSLTTTLGMLFHSKWLKYTAVLAVVFISICNLELSSQTLGRFVYPDSTENTNISIHPTIQIQTTYPVDHSSFTFTYPIGDSIPYTSDEPSIYLIDEYTYDNINDSLWSVRAAYGSFELLSGDTIIQFTTTLSYSTTYYAVLKGLRVVNLTNDTLSVSTIAIRFSTIPPLPDLLNYSSLKTINCSDTLSFLFNVAIDSLSSSAGDFITIAQVTGTTLLDSFHVDNILDTIPLNMWFNGDSTKIYVLPDSGGFLSGSLYEASINLSHQTGDTLDNYGLTVHVIDQFQVTISAKPTISTDSLDGESWFARLPIGTHVFNAGDTAICFAPPYIGNFKFLKWSIDATAYSSSTDISSDTLLITKTCSNLANIKANAMYERMPKDTIVINDTTGITIKVFNSDGDSIGGAGTYFVNSEGKNTDLLVFAGADTSTSFLNWQSANSFYTGSNSRYLKLIGGNGNAVIKPVINLAPCTGMICVKVRFLDSPYERSNASDYITVSPGIGCTSKVVPTTVPCSLVINDNISHCYRIKSIRVAGINSYQEFMSEINYADEDDGKISYHFFDVDLTYGDPCRTVYVELEKKHYFAEFEIVENTNAELMDVPDMYQSIMPPHRSVDFPSPTESNSPYMRVLSYTRDNYKIYWKYLIECETEVTLIPKLKSNKAIAEYEFLTYNTNTGYWPGDSPTNETFVITINQNYTALSGRKIQARLRNKNFRISKIGVPITASDPTILTYLEPEKAFGRNGLRWQLTNGVAPYIDIVFTKAVKTSTVSNNTLYLEDILGRLTDCIDNTRNDWQGGNKLRYYPVTLWNVSWPALNRMRLTLKTTDGAETKYFPPWGIFNFLATTGITSSVLTGEIPLDRNYIHTGFTELPIYKVVAESQQIGDNDLDPNDGPEVFSYIYTHLRNDTRTPYGMFRLPASEDDYWDINENSSHTIDPPIVIWQRQATDDNANDFLLAGCLTEHDNGSAGEQTGEITTFARSNIVNFEKTPGLQMDSFLADSRDHWWDKDDRMGYSESGEINWSDRRFRTTCFPQTVFSKAVNFQFMSGNYGWNYNISIIY